ncbi:uncharacterized protein LOC115237851 [Formica exsecta]|uniref:uncharacterized protein LOC115237851 n=1 Tax=Formica exsecta TaxID=72781 RepID=UPI0011431EE8|nr:uncharacterized protein LOC115237851 [Formica exsecta]
MKGLRSNETLQPEVALPMVKRQSEQMPSTSGEGIESKSPILVTRTQKFRSVSRESSVDSDGRKQIRMVLKRMPPTSSSGSDSEWQPGKKKKTTRKSAKKLRVPLHGARKRGNAEENSNQIPAFRSVCFDCLVLHGADFERKSRTKNYKM